MRRIRFETDPEAAFAGGGGWNLGDDRAFREAPWTTAADGPIPDDLVQAVPTLRDPVSVQTLPQTWGPRGPAGALGEFPPGTSLDLDGLVVRTTGVVGETADRASWALVRLFDRAAPGPLFRFVEAGRLVREVGPGAQVEEAPAAAPPTPSLADTIRIRLDRLRAAVSAASGAPHGGDLWADALQAVSALHARGRLAFSPIVYGHILATSCGGPTDWEAWAALDLEMLSRCDMLYVLMIPGWAASRGVQAEIREAERLGIPVRYINKEDLDD